MNPYGKIDNISNFIHPKYNKKFRYMNDEESILLARNIYKEFLKSGYKNILVIESGTSPLINIINKIRENDDLNILQIKIPRDMDFNLKEWFKTYLLEKELDEVIEIDGISNCRKHFLKNEIDNFNFKNIISKDKFTIYDSVCDRYKYPNEVFKRFNEILKGTDLSNFFKKEILVFDEYINAGTIIRNFNYIVRLFNVNPRFKLSAFCMFLDNPSNYDKIAFTLFDNSTELECYDNGSYPFENRVDLIGYYYYVNKFNFKKIYLKDLIKEVKKDKDIDCRIFFDKLERLVNENNLLSIIKNNCLEKQVRDFVKNEDVVRYLIKYLDRKIYGDNKIYDFLDQVFEIYAPAWSPMPVINHLDYWNSFDKSERKIDEVSDSLINEYKKYRNNVVIYVLEKMLENRVKWEENIDKLLEVKE